VTRPMTQSLPHIRFADVSKSFPTASGAVTALDAVSFDIQQGEIFAVIGYSGAGKSTLVRLINGLESADGGSITVDGTTVTGLAEKKIRPIRSRIGMIFQQFNLFRSRTVFGNIAFPLALAGWSKADQQRRVAELLSFVGLTDKAWVYPDQLSGGQKQRVGIARALATEPTILLADESTSALDPDTTQDVLALLRRINAELGVTIVVITHEMEVVRSIADRVAVLDAGRLIEIGSVDDIFTAPATATTRRFVRTVLHHPDTDDIQGWERHRAGQTLVTVTVEDTAGFSRVLGGAARRTGIEFEIVHGGIVTLKDRSVGSFTVALSGTAEAVAGTAAALRAIGTSAA